MPYPMEETWAVPEETHVSAPVLRRRLRPKVGKCHPPNDPLGSGSLKINEKLPMLWPQVCPVVDVFAWSSIGQVL